MCSFDYRNNYAVRMKTLSRVVLKYHVSMLILPFRVSQNTFQNNCSKFKVPQLLLLPENFSKVFQRHL